MKIYGNSVTISSQMGNNIDDGHSNTAKRLFKGFLWFSLYMQLTPAIK
jgi:hypothetical protein